MSARPDWAPSWWNHTDLHHSAGDTLWIYDPNHLTQPGLLVNALRHAADRLEARIRLDSRAWPTDHRHGENRPGDWDLEDEHHAWLDGDGRARKQLGLMARRLAGLLAARRMELRRRYPDGRPWSRAA